MSKVHLFPEISSLSAGFKLPLQYIGTSETPAKRQVPDTVLLAWIQANITFPITFSVASATITGGSPSISIAAGRLVLGMLVTGSGSGTFDVGTAPGGSDILAGESYSTTPAFFFVPWYFDSLGTLNFDNFSGTLTVKYILINLT